MSTFKKYLLLFLVVMAFLATGLGGLQDMLGIQLVVTKQHGWNDGIFLMLTAILVALTVQ
jgi:hypothetical protein